METDRTAAGRPNGTSPAGTATGVGEQYSLGVTTPTPPTSTPPGKQQTAAQTCVMAEHHGLELSTTEEDLLMDRRLDPLFRIEIGINVVSRMSFQ